MKYIRTYEINKEDDAKEILNSIDNLQQKIQYLQNEKKQFEKFIFPLLKKYLLYKKPSILEITQPDIDEYGKTFRIYKLNFYKEFNFYLEIFYCWDDPYTEEHAEVTHLTQAAYEDFIFFVNYPDLYDKKHKFNV